jgi:hypothetical protein
MIIIKKKVKKKRKKEFRGELRINREQGLTNKMRDCAHKKLDRRIKQIWKIIERYSTC